MWGKRYFQAGALVVFTVLAAGCGAPIIAETTAGFVEQPVETTSVETQESPDSTVASMTTLALPTLEYSLAYVEYQEVKSYVGDDSLESRKIIDDYLSSNPNDASTPMGALCWASHELSRSYVMGTLRWAIDDYLIPAHMEQYGVSSEQLGGPGLEATEAFLKLVSGDPGSVGSVDDEISDLVVPPVENGNVGPVSSTGRSDGLSEEEYWELFRLDHELAGDGTEWSDAVRAIASPKMEAVFRAGEGLPPDVQVYADALVAYAKERIGRELDPSAEIRDATEYDQKGFPGLASFMSVAKYHQDCKRAGIADVADTVDSSSTSTTTTTTIPPVASTTTTTQPTVEETSPSTTSTTAPPSATTTQPLEDDTIPSPTSTTAPVSATTTQPQVEDTSPSTTTTTTLPVDDSVTTTTTQQPVEEPVATTLPQVEDTSPSTTTVPAPPVDDSVATTTTLPPGGGPPTDDGGENGLFNGDGGGG